MGGPRRHPCLRNLAIVCTVRLETAVAGVHSSQNPASECRARAAVGADNEQPHLLAATTSRRRGMQLLQVSTAACIAVLGVIVLAGPSGNVRNGVVGLDAAACRNHQLLLLLPHRRGGAAPPVFAAARVCCLPHATAGVRGQQRAEDYEETCREHRPRHEAARGNRPRGCTAGAVAAAAGMLRSQQPASMAAGAGSTPHMQAAGCCCCCCVLYVATSNSYSAACSFP